MNFQRLNVFATDDQIANISAKEVMQLMRQGIDVITEPDVMETDAPAEPEIF